MTSISPVQIPDPRRSLSIKGLMPGLSERGKIKIGMKGAMKESQNGKSFQAPQKLDHFVVTTLQRGPDGNFLRDESVHKRIGDRPTEIPVRLLYDDSELDFQSRYVCFRGQTLWCSGDGDNASRLRQANSFERDIVPCANGGCLLADPAHQDKDRLRCKMNGTLSVIIDGAGVVGGVWKFRTTSFNSVVGIMSSLALIKRVTGGPLAGIPLMLTLSPKTGITPDGKSALVYVVGLEYRGMPDDLQELGYQRALKMATHATRIEQIESEALRTLRALPIPELDEDKEDLVAEYDPGQAVKVTDNGTQEAGSLVEPKARKRKAAVEPVEVSADETPPEQAANVDDTDDGGEPADLF
ncbi:MAG: hypothetical protein HQL34_07195 [Alphaproteobacteria bacterium]|nr:hypothetical protein [Alphaproteobacteria bacterium]